MSLNWDVSKVEDKDYLWVPAAAIYGEELPRGIKADEKYLNPKVESAIYATMAVGINPITIDNYAEFYKRFLMIRKAMGHDPYLTLEDCFACIGVSTNASQMTYPAFKKTLIAILEREVNYKISQEVKKLNESTDPDSNSGE